MSRPRASLIVQRITVAATVGLAFTWADGRPCQGGGASPRDRMPAEPRVRDDLDSMDISNLLWLAREANRQGRYDQAERHATAAIRRAGIGPEVLCRGMDERLLCGAPHWRSRRGRGRNPVLRRDRRTAAGE